MNAERRSESAPPVDSHARPEAAAMHPEAAAMIPPLEPPAPLTARFGGDDGFARVRSALYTAPSWLTSFVVHLSLLLLLSSLLVPIREVTRPLELLALFTEVEEDAQEDRGQLVEVAVSPLVEDAESVLGEAGDVAESAEAEEVEAGPEAEVPLEEAAEAVVAESIGGTPLIVDAGKEMPDPSATSVVSPVRASKASPTQSILRAVIPKSFDQRTELDEIVDRFIEFDIGVLRGQEGLQAQQRFNALGDSAIPALVRGMNKSASIHASCPVMVIARRLDEQLRRSADPVMVRYALDHLGEGVPSSAPHFTRLRNLRQRIADRFVNKQEELHLAAMRWGGTVDEELLGMAMRASSLSHRDVRVMIAEADARERAAGLLALAIRRGRLDPDERRKMAEAAIDQLTIESDAGLKRFLDGALTDLAQDEGFTLPDSETTASLAERWRAGWAEANRIRRFDEAGRLIAQANQASSRGMTRRAAEICTQVVTDYGDTPFADVAREIASSLNFEKIAAAALQRGEAMEIAGKSSSAVKYYADIVRDYPATKSAGVARQRLKALQSRVGLPSGSE